MKYLLWLLKAAIFFTLFAFALNNQQTATVHFFFGTQWQAPLVLVVLAAFVGGLIAGVLVMVPRWWKQRSTAAKLSQTVTEPEAQAAAPAPAEPLPRRSMEFDLSWILLGLPVAFALGWLASRMDLRQVRQDNRQAPKAYFKGLNFLLNEQQDKAIDAFIEAVQNDPETADLHFALGNLFRRRGEYHRAVRVHEHLLSRADLGKDDRERAQHGLAQDFLKAGLLDRAEEALRRLEGTAYEAEARLALLAIYERSRDWAQAAEIARRMQGANQGDFSGRLAHYLCEQATEQASHAQLDTASQLLHEAVRTAPQTPRPRIELARIQHRLSQSHDAWKTLEELAQTTPQGLPLAVPLMLEVAAATGQQAAAAQLLRVRYAQSPSLDLLDALVALNTTPTKGQGDRRDWYVHHLGLEPSLVAATKWLAGEPLTHEEHHPAVQKALEHASKPLSRYRCAACGFEARQHFWHCPGCQSWDSYPARRVEEL